MKNTSEYCWYSIRRHNYVGSKSLKRYDFDKLQIRLNKNQEAVVVRSEYLVCDCEDKKEKLSKLKKLLLPIRGMTAIKKRINKITKIVYEGCPAEQTQ